MSVEKDAVKTLAIEIKKIIKNLIDNANYDRTYKCQVVASLGSGKYTVKYANITHTALSTRTHAVNSMVYVLVANNNWNNAIIIYP